MVFCDVVRKAWLATRPGNNDWWPNRPATETDTQANRVKFMRSVAFLCCALANLPVESTDAGVRLIMKQWHHYDPDQPLDSVAIHRMTSVRVQRQTPNNRDAIDCLDAWAGPYCGDRWSGSRCPACLPLAEPKVPTHRGPHPANSQSYFFLIFRILGC